MKNSKLNISKHTTGTKGNYSVKMEVNETEFEFNSIDGYLNRVVERYQDNGFKTYATVDNGINTKKEFVNSVKWQLKNTKEVTFL